MSYLSSFKTVHTFMFDVDGVMTDGQMLVTDSGEFLRRMSTRDGYALKLAVRSGYHVAVITGGSSPGVEHRLRLLGIPSIFSGISDKPAAFAHWLEMHPCDTGGILYMGDDLPDFEIMQMVGVPCCPADADPSIQALSVYVSSRQGGEGCVRDVIEKTMRIQGKWPYP
jgi:3-deoxy-D-manno-octulosonate 8-phosphate phosphatase (KDO 8-P phosphatase)